MRKIYAIVVLLFTITVSSAQNLDVTYKAYGDNYTIAVIKPTVENFIVLLNLDDNGFENEMKKHKYFEDNSGGRYRSFWNGSIDNFVYANCVNTFNLNIINNEIRFMLNFDMEYPKGIISSLLKDLKPYYKKSQNNTLGYTTDYFAFKIGDYYYEFYYTQLENRYDISAVRTKIENDKP